MKYKVVSLGLDVASGGLAGMFIIVAFSMGLALGFQTSRDVVLTNVNILWVEVAPEVLGLAIAYQMFFMIQRFILLTMEEMVDELAREVMEANDAE